MPNWNLVDILTPWIDPATTVSSSIGYKYSKAAENMGYATRKYFGPLDWNIVFTNIMPVGNPGTVIYTGHGFPDYWMGSDFIMGSLRKEQAYLLKDRLVIAVPSCLTARPGGIGEKAIDEGCLCYIGSTDFVWVAWNEWDHNYNQDFELSWFILVYNILNGMPVYKAVKTYQEFCTQKIELYEKLKLPNGDYYASNLAKNRDGLIALGNDQLKLKPPNRLGENQSIFNFAMESIIRGFI